MKAIVKATAMLGFIFGFNSFATEVVADDVKSQSIQEFSTSEIVAEYHRRLNQLLDANLEFILAASSYLQDERALSEETGTGPDARTAQSELALEEAKTNILRNLMLFAEKGDLRAQEIAGPAVLATALDNAIISGFPINDPDSCNGLQHTFSAAQNGSVDAIGIIPLVYLVLRGPLVLKVDQESIAKKTEYARNGAYWMWERERITGLSTPNELEKFLEQSGFELDQLKQEWIEWSPARASIDDALQVLCPSWVE